MEFLGFNYGVVRVEFYYNLFLLFDIFKYFFLKGSFYWVGFFSVDFFLFWGDTFLLDFNG